MSQALLCTRDLPAGKILPSFAMLKYARNNQLGVRLQILNQNWLLNWVDSNTFSPPIIITLLTRVVAENLTFFYVFKSICLCIYLSIS